VKSRYGALMALGDELLLLDTSSGKPIATHINLSTAETRNEEVGAVTNLMFAANDTAADGPPGSKGLAGLPVGKPGKDSDKAMDPQTVAQKAQSMSYPARVALPAMLSNPRVQERTLDEMDDNGSKP